MTSPGISHRGSVYTAVTLKEVEGGQTAKAAEVLHKFCLDFFQKPNPTPTKAFKQQTATINQGLQEDAMIERSRPPETMRPALIPTVKKLIKV